MSTFWGDVNWRHEPRLWALLLGCSVPHLPWDRVAWGHGSTDASRRTAHRITQAQQAPLPGTAQGHSTADPKYAVPKYRPHPVPTSLLAPRQPPRPVPAPCLPGTVIVQLLRGGGRSPGAVCVSKGLCGKITRAGGGGGVEGGGGGGRQNGLLALTDSWALLWGLQHGVAQPLSSF